MLQVREISYIKEAYTVPVSNFRINKDTEIFRLAGLCNWTHKVGRELLRKRPFVLNELTLRRAKERLWEGNDERMTCGDQGSACHRY